MSNKVGFLIQLKDRYSATARKIAAQNAKMQASFGKVSGKVKDMQGSLTSAGKGMAKTGAVMTAAVTAPLAMLSKSMVSAAADATDTANRFKVVFRDSLGDANKSVTELSKAFDISKSTAQGLMAEAGALASSLGLPADRTAELARQIVSLSGDVTSFNDVKGGITRTSTAFTKALLGEREMLKETFKISVLQSEVAKQALIEKRKDNTLTKKQAEALATITLVQKRSTLAVGDYSKTQRDYNNVVRANQERMKELAIVYGQLMMPVAKRLAVVLAGLMTWLKELSPAWKKLIIFVGAFVAIGGPLLLLLGGIALAVGAISAPVLIVSAAVAALVAGIVLAWDKLKVFKQWMIDSGLLSGGEQKVNLLDGRRASRKAPSAPVSSGGSISGEITVSAEKGARVGRVAARNRGKMNVGMNVAGA